MNAYTLDPSGDLFLELYEQQAEGVVGQFSQPQCVFLLSYKAELDRCPTGRERSRYDPAFHRVYGDNEDALLIVLQAAHLRARQIPTNVTIDLFHQVAVVCHKYDMAQILLPWPTIWIHGLPCTTDVGKWLEIAWVFRKVKLCKQITRRLVMHSKLDGSQLALLGTSYGGEIVPERVLAIAGIFACSTTLLEDYTNAASTGRNTCRVRVPKKHSTRFLSRWQRNTTIRDQCDSIQAGTLLRFLASVGFFPVQREKDHRSVSEIVTAFGRAARHRRTPEADLDHVACCAVKIAHAVVVPIMGSCEGLALSDFVTDTSIFDSVASEGEVWPMFRV